jgi:hypothetical protein
MMFSTWMDEIFSPPEIMISAVQEKQERDEHTDIWYAFDGGAEEKQR